MMQRGMIVAECITTTKPSTRKHLNMSRLSFTIFSKMTRRLFSRKQSRFYLEHPEGKRVDFVSLASLSVNVHPLLVCRTAVLHDWAAPFDFFLSCLSPALSFVNPLTSPTVRPFNSPSASTSKLIVDFLFLFVFKKLTTSLKPSHKLLNFAQTLEFFHGGTIWPVLSGQVPRLEAGSQQKAKWRGEFLFLQMTSKWRKGAVTSGWLKVFGERDWSRVN